MHKWCIFGDNLSRAYENHMSMLCSYELLVYISLTWCCQWITLFFLRFCILTYYNNWKSRPIILNGNKSKINQKTQSIANSYEYEELSLTTTKFANVVPHRLKNDAIFWNDYLYLEALGNMKHSLASPANLEFLTSIFLRDFLRFNAFLHSFKLISRQKVRIYCLDPEDVDNVILFLSAHQANTVWPVQNNFLLHLLCRKKN